MPKTITLEGAYLNSGHMALDKKKGAKTVSLNFTMKWTARVANALGWTAPAEGQESVQLQGGMAAHTMTFEAGGKTFNLGSGLFEQFKVIRIESEGKRPKFELRGQYTTHLPGIAAIAEKYADTTSRAQGDLHIEYDKIETESEDSSEPKQGELVDMS